MRPTMPAIVPIDAASTRDDHRGVERELRKAFLDYWRGWEQHSFSDPDYVYVAFLEGRIRAIETSVRRLLTSGVLTESQRTGLLLTAYGSKTGTLKDANLLTATETRLIENYRQIDNVGRSALRGLLDSLSGKGGAQ